MENENVIQDDIELRKSVKYGEDDIQVLEGLDPVRKRPGMYIGSTDERGLQHLIVEIVDNSIDEALAGYCNKIIVDLNKDGSVTVLDNGRGIPTGMHKTEHKSAVEVVLTKLHAGGKFGGDGYKISGGLHGVGLSVVNALSKWLTVEVYQNNQHYKQEYVHGLPQAPLAVVGDANTTGTKVTFLPDDEIFETTIFNFDSLNERFREIAFLNKGLTIELNDKRDEEAKSVSYCFEGGIKEFVTMLNKGKETIFDDVLYFQKIGSNYEVEICMQYNTGYSESIHAYANNINTVEGGTHLEGFKKSLTKIINDYAVANKYIKENEKMTGDDVREGITAVISVKLTEPQFEGQTKTKLGNSEMRAYVDRTLSDGFGAYLEENPAKAKEVIIRCITAQKARDAARNARELTRRKTVLEHTTLPGKLADCTDKNAENCEIYLVEGDSAGGTAKQGRDRKFQAIMPLRGKILNVEKVGRIAKILENQEIKNMITAFGCGINEEFNEEKLRYHKIICMTDADVDGSHIRILMLTFFFRFMRPLIEKGYVYIAQPPLYRLAKNKSVKYFYDDEDLNNYLNKIDKKGIELQRYKGLGEMNAEQLWSTTMNPETRTLLRVTMEDAMKAEETLSMLMGDNPELRREFIQNNATLVENLDI